MSLSTLQLFLTNFENDQCRDSLFEFSKERKEIDREMLIWLMREARKNGAHFLKIGGEPLAHSKIKELIQKAKEFGYFIELETSGKLFLRHLIWLKKEGVEKISLTFLGTTDDIHDFMRGKFSFLENMAAAEAAKNHGFQLGVQYIFGRHNVFESVDAVKFLNSFSADEILAKEILPFGRALENGLSLNYKESQHYFHEIKNEPGREKIHFDFLQGWSFDGREICESLRNKILVADWDGKVSSCQAKICGGESRIVDISDLSQKQFKNFMDEIGKDNENSCRNNPERTGGCERCLGYFRKKYQTEMQKNDKKEIVYMRENRMPRNSHLNALEIDLTNVGKLNNLFYRQKEENFLEVEKIFDFWKKISIETPIRNILLRGIGDPINHPKLFSVVDFFIKSQAAVNIFTFPDQIEKYAEALGELLPKVSLSVYHYPEENYQKILDKIDSVKERIAAHFYIANNESFDNLEKFLEYCDKNTIAPNIIRVMSERSPLDSQKKSAIDMIITDKNLHRNIFWENGRDFNCQCSYQRNQRMFINSKGQISFCHFLPHLDQPQLDLYKTEGIDIVRLYHRFKENKERICQRGDFCFDIEDPSPCDYCYHFWKNDLGAKL